MRNAHKMATGTSGNAGRALMHFSLFDSLASLFVAKDRAGLVLELIGVSTVKPIPR